MKNGRTHISFYSILIQQTKAKLFSGLTLNGKPISENTHNISICYHKGQL